MKIHQQKELLASNTILVKYKQPQFQSIYICSED